MAKSERKTLPESFYKAATLILFSLLVLWFFWQQVMQNGGEASAGEDLSAPDIGADAPIPVQTARAFRGDLVIRIQSMGTTRALRQLVFHAAVSGRIRRVAVQEGQAVRKGALLFQMEDEAFRLALEEAEEQLAQATLRFGEQLGERQRDVLPDTGSALLSLEIAEKRLQKAREAYEKGKIPRTALQLAEQEYEAARLFHRSRRKELIALRTGVTAALLRVEKAQFDLQRTRAVAPFSGVIGNVQIQPGMYVSAGTECLTLVDLDSLLMDVDILESELAEVEKGQRAVAQFSAFPGETFPGRVISVNPLVDPERKTRRITVLLPNSERRLLPGMHGTVKLDARIYRNRFLVPREAVVLRDQRPVVFIARKDVEGKWRAVWSYVEIGLQNEEYVEIRSSRFNLKEGEPVIISNHYTMVHDARDPLGGVMLGGRFLFIKARSGPNNSIY
ncbi:MAG: efflux RND transporter periplasmic adaptor subunit [candidate division KSB1 bacterium]|nr:efflux RND transporter periplasmic adaptor subunit [candidate division KSB1 bacterium]